MPKIKAHPTLQPLSLSDVLEQQRYPDVLRFMTCGNMNDGKSSLIGRLLWESQQVLDDQLITLQADSKHHGMRDNDLDFSLLFDGLADEREQGITIDVAYRFFSTPQRKFMVADTPGHEHYTRNMVTGASNTDVAVLVIDARRGILTQTRRHVHLASLLGVRHIILAINKMDLVAYNRQIFESILTTLQTITEPLGFQNITAIPLSALKGDNITTRSPNTPWYTGPTLISHLESIEIQRTSSNKVVFPVQWVNRPNADFQGFSGTLASGELALGDEVRITASGKTAKVTRLMTTDGEQPKAICGDAITLVLDQEVNAFRGDVIALADKPLEMTDQFEANLIWMADDAGLIGRAYELKLANQWSGATITTLKYRLNVDTQAPEPCRQLKLNDIAVANLALSKPMVFAPYAESQTLGGFILVDAFTHETVAAGMIRHNLRRAQNVHHQALSITRRDREQLNGHEGKVIWFTGLSGSGKSALANALEKELHTQGKRTYILDGDNIRQGINRDLGFTDADRVENIRRVAEVAKLMMDAGLIVITAFISPFRAEREVARQLIGKESFIEVFLDTPLEVCERRDPKGLYKKARTGLLPNMTGINSPYEMPEQPNLKLDTSHLNIEVAVQNLLKLLLNHR